ncbi:hypothetical protein LCGC14_0142310 [marine sediment metagenome]|uniref:Uncharacterized protein n=1 Tax=marine sediment metagenome TaxID=412755 RepID=A0A0F9XIG0_9ZZZZ
MCYECEQNPDRPHICAEAQNIGQDGKCCGLESKICFSFREISTQARLQWGDGSPESYMQAIFNSKEMRLEFQRDFPNN